MNNLIDLRVKLGKADDLIIFYCNIQLVGSKRFKDYGTYNLFYHEDSEEEDKVQLDIDDLEVKLKDNSEEDLENKMEIMIEIN